MSPYNPYPLGMDWWKQWEMPDFVLLKDRGYKLEDYRDACDLFERKLCEFTGASYCVLTDSCTNAIFLTFLALNEKDLAIMIPGKTYVSVPMSLIHAGYTVVFDRNVTWDGFYRFAPFGIWDAAMSFFPEMYKKIDLKDSSDKIVFLSFQLKKRLPIGKGGAVLLQDKWLYLQLKKLAYEGRDIRLSYDSDNISMLGYNCYMSPESAARGVRILDDLIKMNGPWDHVGGSENYPDVSNMEVFKRCPNVRH